MLQYQLTNGTEVFADTDWFTPAEAREANRNLKNEGLWWEPVQWGDGDADYLMATYSDKN